MMIEGMFPDPIAKQAAAGPSQAAEEKNLKEACQQFEEMLDQERAKSWSQEGGVGLASMMFEQMKKNM